MIAGGVAGAMISAMARPSLPHGSLTHDDDVSFRLVGQGVCLTLKRFGDPLGRPSAAEGAGAGAIETDAPPSDPGDHLVQARFRRSETERMDATRHHRTGLLNVIRTPSFSVIEDVAPKTAPSIAIVMVHTLKGGGSLRVASTERVLIRVIQRLHLRADIPLLTGIKLPCRSGPSASNPHNARSRRSEGGLGRKYLGGVLRITLQDELPRRRIVARLGPKHPRCHLSIQSLPRAFTKKIQTPTS